MLVVAFLLLLLRPYLGQLNGETRRIAELLSQVGRPTCRAWRDLAGGADSGGMTGGMEARSGLGHSQATGGHRLQC